MAEPGIITIPNAEIRFRNFTGLAQEYNNEGDRNFCVLISDELADELDKDGWNIRMLKLRDGEVSPQKYLSVSIKYRNKDGSKARTPPTMVYITSRGQTSLTEDEVEIFDYIDIAKVDLSIRPYVWSFGGKSGVKAYVKELYITAEESQLALMYRDVPKVDLNGNQLELESSETAGGDFIEGEAWFEEDPKELEA